MEVRPCQFCIFSVFCKEFWTGDARMGFAPNQLAEARTLADFVASERRSPHFVVVGDFNSLPGSPVDRYLREERGFVEAFSTVQRFDVDPQTRKVALAREIKLGETAALIEVPQ